MLNLIEILFLIFGWIFHIKGLIIASLIVSSVFMLCTLCIVGEKIQKGEKHSSLSAALLIQLVCFSLSIIKLCIF